MKKQEIDKNLDISFPKDGHNELIKIENNSFWFNHRNNIIETIIEKFPIDGDFADIGGGNGYQLMKIAELNPSNKNILIEPGQIGCINAKNRKIKEVFNMTFEEFDFNAYNINGIGLFDVLEHIENDKEFLSKLLYKLKKGARIYITVPAHNFLWSEVDTHGGHFRRYNKKSLNKLTEGLNVEIECFSYFFSYLLPISLFVRAIPFRIFKKKETKKLMEEEKTHHSPNNFILKVFSFFEKIEIKKLKKSTVKLGASCFLVIKKK